MKDANKMTAYELRKLADEKDKKEEFKPAKSGILKHSLYWINPSIILPVDGEHILKDKVDYILKDLFCLAVKKNSLVLCEIGDDGQEYWYCNSGYGLEAENKDWARDNLINIKELK